MTKPKLSTTPIEGPPILVIELSAEHHRKLADYAQVLGRQTKQHPEPTGLIAPIPARLMATNRDFSEIRSYLVRFPKHNDT
jgi:hypothetical protein